MFLKYTILAFALLIGSASVAVSSERPYLIFDDPGGEVGAYLQRYHVIKQTHRKVIVVGRCYSACTLVLTLPRSQVCATPTGRLGFHAVSDSPGGPVDATATRAFFSTFYPPALATFLLSRPLTTVPYVVPATQWLPEC